MTSSIAAQSGSIPSSNAIAPRPNATNHKSIEVALEALKKCKQSEESSSKCRGIISLFVVVLTGIALYTNVVGWSICAVTAVVLLILNQKQNTLGAAEIELASAISFELHTKENGEELSSGMEAKLEACKGLLSSFSIWDRVEPGTSWENMQKYLTNLPQRLVEGMSPFHHYATLHKIREIALLSQNANDSELEKNSKRIANIIRAEPRAFRIWNYQFAENVIVALRPKEVTVRKFTTQRLRDIYPSMTSSKEDRELYSKTRALIVRESII